MANASGFHADHFTILIDSVLYYVYMGHMIDGILKKYWQWRPIASNSIYYTLSKIEMVIDFLNKSDNYAGLAPKQIAKQLLTDLNDVQTR